jgi:hypothetical protein
MAERLTQNRSAPLLELIRDFRMDENDHRIDHFAVDVLIGNIGERLRVGFPSKAFRLKAEHLHCRRRCRPELSTAKITARCRRNRNMKQTFTTKVAKSTKENSKFEFAIARSLFVSFGRFEADCV